MPAWPHTSQIGQILSLIYLFLIIIQIIVNLKNKPEAVEKVRPVGPPPALLLLVMRSMADPLVGYWLIEMRFALLNASVPATTTLSPCFRPETISTADMLVAPMRIGVRTAIPSRTT